MRAQVGRTSMTAEMDQWAESVLGRIIRLPQPRSPPSLVLIEFRLTHLATATLYCSLGKSSKNQSWLNRMFPNRYSE